jgi:RNA polymerase sigma-70 factor (sigma-E family)
MQLSGHDDRRGHVDEQGFTEWASGRQRQLLRSAYLLTGDLHRAEDLVQEALTKVALRWSRLAEGDPTAYALRIIARDNISWWRRRRDVPTDTFRDAGASAEPEIALVVRRALARLTPGQRAVLVLRHFEDLTERETADVLGISVGTVKSQNAAGLDRLRTGAPELLSLIGRAP